MRSLPTGQKLKRALGAEHRKSRSRDLFPSSFFLSILRIELGALLIVGQYSATELCLGQSFQSDGLVMHTCNLRIQGTKAGGSLQIEGPAWATWWSEGCLSQRRTNSSVRHSQQKVRLYGKQDVKLPWETFVKQTN